MSIQTTTNFSKTPRQQEAVRLLGGDQRHTMLYGGSRSGKTFILCYALIVRACKTPSRHAIVRLHFNHVKTSIWLDTLPKVFKLCFPDLDETIKWNNTDYYVEFPNGSELWVAGLDDKKRVEKILGREFSTIFFNECSQIPYAGISIALTRLAEKNSLKKKAYYDENPPNKRHWSYPLFILGKDPETWEELKRKTNYSHFLMNPGDNIENIDPEYITDVLDELPAKQRARFLLGEFTDEGIGSIYYAFDREKNVRPVKLNPQLPIYVGMDFNVNPMTAVIGQVSAREIVIFDEIYLDNSNTSEMAQVLNQKFGTSLRIVPDATGKALKTSAAGLSDHEILRRAGFSVESSPNPFRMDRYNAVNKLLEDGRLTIDPKCVKLIKDLEQLAYKEGTNLPDVSDKMIGHISDGLGYLVYKTHGIRPQSSPRSVRF